MFCYILECRKITLWVIALYLKKIYYKHRLCNIKGSVGMRFFRYLAVLVLVVLLLAAAGCGGNGGEVAEPSDNESGNGAIEENGDENGDENGVENGGETAVSEVKVVVTPPEGWEEADESTALVSYMKGTASFMVVREKVAAGIDGLDGFLAKAREKLSETFADPEFSSIENVKVDGYNGRKFFFSTKVAGLPFRYLIIYVFRDGYIYHLQGCALGDDFDALLPEFEAFISSFRFE